VRTLLFTTGVAACLVAVTGPLAQRAAADFGAHMVVHLLLGMLGPLMLVLAAPVTLALRTLPVRGARTLVRLLDTWPVRFLVHLVTAATLNLGGLWVLYTTSLYALTLSSPLVHGLVHAHVVVSGYLFASAIVGVDPDRHRRSLFVRTAVLVAFVAGHSILAKYLYAHPPTGVDAVQAELGAMVMYYGGDAVDLVLLVLLGHRWYLREPQRLSRAPSRRSPAAPPRRWAPSGLRGQARHPTRQAGRRVRPE
jgi:putative membrane protein